MMVESKLLALAPHVLSKAGQERGRVQQAGELLHVLEEQARIQAAGQRLASQFAAGRSPANHSRLGRSPSGISESPAHSGATVANQSRISAVE